MYSFEEFFVEDGKPRKRVKLKKPRKRAAKKFEPILNQRKPPTNTSLNNIYARHFYNGVKGQAGMDQPSSSTFTVKG